MRGVRASAKAGCGVVAKIPAGSIQNAPQAGLGKDPVIGGIVVSLRWINKIGEGVLSDGCAANSELGNAGTQDAMPGMPGQLFEKSKGVLQVIEHTEAYRQTKSALAQVEAVVNVADLQLHRRTEGCPERCKSQGPIIICGGIFDRYDAAAEGLEEE